MSTETVDAERILNALPQFTGTHQWYRHWTGALNHTDGIQYLAEACRAHWLIDIVASYQPGLDDEFQVWRLEKAPTRDNPDRWVVHAWNDTPGRWQEKDSEENGIIKRRVRQFIPFTDFPEELSGFEWYVERGMCGAIMLLKGEH